MRVPPIAKTLQQTHLDMLKAEAADLLATKLIKSEEGRALLNLITRLLETLAGGEPKTPKIERHHT